MFKAVSDEKWKRINYPHFGGFADRLLAFIIDIVVFIPIFLIFIAISIIGNLNLPSEILSGLFIIYIIVFHWKKGATIGKRQTGLRVESRKGQRISLVQSTLREFFSISAFIFNYAINQSFLNQTTVYSGERSAISFNMETLSWHLSLSLLVLLIVLIDVLWIFTNKEKKALHDIIAGTYCKKK